MLNTVMVFTVKDPLQPKFYLFVCISQCWEVLESRPGCRLSAKCSPSVLPCTNLKNYWKRFRTSTAVQKTAVLRELWALFVIFADFLRHPHRKHRHKWFSSRQRWTNCLHLLAGEALFSVSDGKLLFSLLCTLKSLVTKFQLSSLRTR